jgi:hypothetical protein
VWRLLVTVVCLAAAVCVHAGGNPDIKAFIEFENGYNTIEPTVGVPFTATVYLEDFGPGEGVSAMELALAWTFSGYLISYQSLLPGGLTIGDPQTGWTIAGSECTFPDTNSRVAVAELTFLYDGGSPGTLELLDHPVNGRVAFDCSFETDEWCVRTWPSGHAAVGPGATPPPGDCLVANMCLEVWKDVDCDISVVGDEVVYMICVWNCAEGPVPLYDLTVTDPLLGGVLPGFPSTLGVGETVCIEFPYVVQQQDPDPLENIVEVVANDGLVGVVTEYATEMVDLIHPSFQVTVDCISGLVPAGGDAEFEVTIQNTGDCDLLITTDEPQIPPHRLEESGISVWPVLVPDPGGVTEICETVDVLAEVPPEYCDIDATYMDSDEACCQVAGAPTILTVSDIGNDQGRNVRLRWQRSHFDAPGQPYQIASYELYRRQDAYVLGDPVEGADWVSDQDAPAAMGDDRLDGWDYVATVPAHGDSFYQCTAPTLCDSTAESGICWSVFFVRGATTDPYTYFDSLPDSGYSVDNLAPAPPSGLLADGDETLVSLTWDISEEEDFDYYAVYMGESEDFVPAEPIGFTSNASFEDASPPAVSEWWYRVTAFDFAGNESAPSEAAGVVATGTDGANPSRFWLAPAVPNPFERTTAIEYWIPDEEGGRSTSLTVYDASGRTVRTLVEGDVAPGVHMEVWDGRDDAGAPVANGVYFCKLETEQHVSSRKLIVVR